MNEQLKCGAKIRLKSFHNTTKAPSDTDKNENYWKLVGSVGEIVSDQQKVHPAFVDMGKRVLVKFDDIEKYGLTCHNEIPNTLWIFISDLESLDTE